MKELKTISDEELLRQIQSGNNDAMECLLERYRDMVRKEARRFFLAGGDEEDLIQEGMIGLFKAVTSYQEEKNTSFSILHPQPNCIQTFSFFFYNTFLDLYFTLYFFQNIRFLF